MKIERVASYPLSIAVFAGRTAWESYERGGRYIVPTDNINKNDYNFLFTLFNNLKHWSVAEHLWYTFELNFSNPSKMYETMFYVKNEYNFFSEVKDRNTVVFSVNLRTILEEINDFYEGNYFVKKFYQSLIKHLPGVHKMLLKKEKYDEAKIKILSVDNTDSLEIFKAHSEENSIGHKVSVLYKQEVTGYDFRFMRRPHIFYTFFIENFSRAMLQEIVRHDDLLAATVKSSRFTLKELKTLDDNSLKKYVIGPENPKIKRIQKDLLIEVRELLKENIKIDEIKYILPEGYKTKAVLTYNIKNLENLIKLRTESNTKVLWEFYELSKILKKVK